MLPELLTDRRPKNMGVSSSTMVSIQEDSGVVQVDR